MASSRFDRPSSDAELPRAPHAVVSVAQPDESAGPLEPEVPGANARAAIAGPPVDRHARALIARIRKNWHDVEAIRTLAHHYTRAGDYASLANLMEGWAHALRDPQAAADAYVEAADAVLMAGHGSAEARVLYERALSRQASHTQALDRLTRLLDEARDFERLKQVLKYVAFRLEQEQGSRSLLATVHYRLGQVYELHFGELRKAAGLYRRAIDENPRLIAAISAARRLYLDSGNYKTVSVLYEFEIEASTLPEDKHNLLLSLGRHKRERCDDLDGAILAFRRANKLAPHSTRALFSLGEALLARSERAEPLAAAADRQRAAEVFFYLARGVGPADAVPYLQRALLIMPEHVGARALLDQLTGRPSDGPRASNPAPRGAGGPEPSSADAAAWLRGEGLETAEPLPRESARELAGLDALPPSALQPSPIPPNYTAQDAVAPAAGAGKLVGALTHDPARVPLEVNVGNTTDSNFYVDVSDQLIDGGVYVATYEALPVGTKTSLTITLPGRLIARAHGLVTLTRDLMDAFDDHIPGMCIAFEALDAKSFALVQRFARKRAPMLIEP